MWVGRGWHVTTRKSFLYLVFCRKEEGGSEALYGDGGGEWERTCRGANGRGWVYNEGEEHDTWREGKEEGKRKKEKRKITRATEREL